MILYNISVFMSTLCGQPPVFERLLLEEKVVATRPDEVEKRTPIKNRPHQHRNKRAPQADSLPCVKGGAERSEAEGLA